MLKLSGREILSQALKPSDRNLNCDLCTKERVEIYKAMKLDEKATLNFSLIP